MGVKVQYATQIYLLTSPSWFILMSVSILPLTEPNPPYSGGGEREGVNNQTPGLYTSHMISRFATDLLCRCHTDWRPPARRHLAASHWQSLSGSAHLSSCRNRNVTGTRIHTHHDRLWYQALAVLAAVHCIQLMCKGLRRLHIMITLVTRQIHTSHTENGISLFNAPATLIKYHLVFFSFHTLSY